jgi:hypothetical protein
MGCVQPIAVATSLCDVFPATHAACTSNIGFDSGRSGRFFVCHYIAEWSEWDERHRR